ncbi:DNA polymerase/3'-5' exonuclease PolX [bacterium HR40]|nr:DNA polymerase/3'-5' exonuclease PolX [bacterium HR40]
MTDGPADGRESRNRRIADRLRQAAELLEAQGANPFRVKAYRDAAATVETLDRDVGEILEEQGLEGLERLPRIGRSLAAAIEEMVRTGRWAQLERLKGAVDPVALFASVPGLGPELARRIHDTLGIDTLEELELAAHDGRLLEVRGIGPERAAMLRAVLAETLARTRRRGPRQRPREEPDVATLLDVDAEYRSKAEAGRLPRIAPRRFNPTGEAWLPVLHTQRGPWHFTALYSNTALAHQLGTVRDWVVIYFHRDGEAEEGQRTVVTETRGPLAGRRVVRGREGECRAHYGL